ncbi:MAG: hypothetical protein IPL22_06035 [Bacteroidetes bacterium]|nr:hypothetical protein [Bacteroidota bacterium]
MIYRQIQIHFPNFEQRHYHAITLFLFLLLVPALGSGQTANKLNLKLAQVASGFTSPVGMACPDDGTFRIFVFEQGGKVYIIKNGQVLKEPFLNISNRWMA